MTHGFNPLGDGPVRLSTKTRELAWRYLSGGFAGRLVRAGDLMSGATGCPGADNQTRHAELAARLAASAPLEIVPEELLAGAAPFMEATEHLIPGWPGMGSISHTTVDFGDAVAKGLSGLEAELAELNRRESDPGRAGFRRALLTAAGAMRTWMWRYAAAYEDMAENCGDDGAGREFFFDISAVLRRLMTAPPSNFREALQSFWLFFEFQRLCGNWSGLGRFDLILGKYLERDLASGAITPGFARELVAHFWIKGTEWCHGLRAGSRFAPGSGDAQVYQNIILGGIDPATGLPVENAVTFLVLDVIEELHISDYPVAVRVGPGTSEQLLRRIAEVQLCGGGIVSIYNEPVVLAGLRGLGIPERQALSFTNDGCWEVIVPGRTNFGYRPFDALIALQRVLFPPRGMNSFESLYAGFTGELAKMCDDLRDSIEAEFYTGRCSHPAAVLSLLMPSCRESGRSYCDFGAEYTVRAIHAGGLPDVANSLLAIKKYVFDEKRLTLAELSAVLENDWHGAEALRREIVRDLICYGNDDDAADAMMLRVFNDYTAIVAARSKVRDVLVPCGVSTFGREIEFARRRKAVAFGRFAGEYLAPNLSPTPGTGRLPLTAAIRSYCKMDFTRTPNGCPLDLRLEAGIRGTGDAAAAVVELLRGFIKLGGFYLQLDTVSVEMLREARRDPDRFPNLVVRISGWSARFATLSGEWQEMIINRAAGESRS
ncbi:MAG: pyruvate formate lyase family protein [Victivallaceae bacterium]|nr:pyruvate formate lyase family protein [Victivallaceae bacterium]